MTKLIELSGATVRFGNVTALDGCDVAFERGEFVAITGPSGSGKSTLLNLVGLLDRPTEGHYALDGCPTESLSEASRAALRAEHFGFVFQSFHLLGHRTVLENVAMGALYAGMRRKDRYRFAQGRLESVGLAHRVDALANTLSGGEAQRVAVARALMGDPQVLLCDEPTGNLDSENTEAILELLDRCHDGGKTVVVITHEDEVASRAERRIVLRDGRIAEDERRVP